MSQKDHRVALPALYTLTNFVTFSPTNHMADEACQDCKLKDVIFHHDNLQLQRKLNAPE